ncbi:hypothetical protein QKU48_gp0709 [Fadolivirus algeromassiliense]|jgi:hypothetical protein|uniref:Uncharacterized protein n=1 Tax=Fadolivirus FV1/VV64 TaxID=3070911 RepID=A0A7D3QUI7_9VIRU|nr:hypothetical protein QKU48_gp0709 [Fadolivirus algeromassiliense]QKF94167.1 hypothetical protein Fadolivirus_1_709 [Fadolivirus FV1/VV64]
MSCNNFDTCTKKEKENMGYPIDSESLYFNRFQDNQIANQRCYNENPVEFIEGFGCKISWNKVLKLTVVILLVVLFVMLAKDFFMPKKQLPALMSEGSTINISPINK